MIELALAAPNPASWLATHLDGRHERDEANDAPRRIVGRAALLAGDAAALRALHGGLLDRGAPPPAAATYLAGWFAGGVAGSIGYGLATASAGFVVAPDLVRWTLHPDGWPERIDLGRARVVVPVAHPWAGQDGVSVVDGLGAMVEAAVNAVVDAVAPIVEACRGLAKVGRAGLWNEVGDALGTALAYQLDVRVTPAMVAVLDAAVRVRGAPWRARPDLRFADASFGRLHVVQKGGCCLAYTEVVPEPDYCLTCSLRDPADSDARQVAWMEDRHRERTRTPP